MMGKLKGKMLEVQVRAMVAIKSKRAEGYVDTIVKMAIAVVIGAIILAALMAIVGDESDGLLGVLSEQLENLFD